MNNLKSAKKYLEDYKKSLREERTKQILEKFWTFYEVHYGKISVLKNNQVTYKSGKKIEFWIDEPDETIFRDIMYIFGYREYTVLVNNGGVIFYLSDMFSGFDVDIRKLYIACLHKNVVLNYRRYGEKWMKEHTY